MEFNLKTINLRKIEDPNEKFTKYVGYFSVRELIENKLELENWFSLNPRSQNMKTDVSKKIDKSLSNNNNFHLLNRGVLFSASKVRADNKKNTIKMIFKVKQLHGNIDGGTQWEPFSKLFVMILKINMFFWNYNWNRK